MTTPTPSAAVRDLLGSIRSKTASWTPTKHVVLLPLEPMEERYTAQWFRDFPNTLQRLGIAVTIVTDHDIIKPNEAPPEMPVHQVTTGTVLDATGTIQWKMRQMSLFATYVRDFTGKDLTVLTMDLQHPGLESIRYMCQLRGIAVRVYGYLHASSYTTEDFAAPMTAWMMPFEYAWINLCDRVFIGSKYHKEKVIRWRCRAPWEWMDKFAIVRAPFTTPYTPEPDSSRPIDVIWPHRFDREKRPNKALDVFEDIKAKYPLSRLVVCTSRPLLPGSSAKCPKFLTNDPTSLERLQKLVDDGTVEFVHCPSKADYYDLLKQSKTMLSTTIEENFGYCFVEAVAHGVFPIVPGNYSHPEFFDDEMDAGHTPLGILYLEGSDLAKTVVAGLEHLKKNSINGLMIRNSWATLLDHCAHSIQYMVWSMFPDQAPDAAAVGEETLATDSL